MDPKEGHNDDDNLGELASSELGTKAYWEECYELELDNFEDYGDQGENWFGEGITRKIVAWLSSHVNDKSSPILDIGCGNGVLLSRLHASGFTSLVGVDYSEKAVALARQISEANGISSIIYSSNDVLDGIDDVLKLLPSDKSFFSVVLDKGTYDAICLTPNANIEELRAKYFQAVFKLLNKDGLFIITSCNWTKDELLCHITANSDLNHLDEIVTPCISYAGHEGNQIACLIFSKAVI